MLTLLDVGFQLGALIGLAHISFVTLHVQITFVVLANLSVPDQLLDPYSKVLSESGANERTLHEHGDVPNESSPRMSFRYTQEVVSPACLYTTLTSRIQYLSRQLP
jgi:hypothetical protein